MVLNWNLATQFKFIFFNFNQRHVKSLQDFLKSPDVDMRIIAGETIAFLFELAQCDSHAVIDVDMNLFCWKILI